MNKPFQNRECKACIKVGTHYCWNECAYNRWKEEEKKGKLRVSALLS